LENRDVPILKNPVCYSATLLSGTSKLSGKGL